MAAEKIHLAIQRHFHQAQTLGDTVMETWSEEDIHQFRVEVKKLRACLRLAAATHTGLKGRLPGRLRVFYSMTGMIRCLQLQRKGLEEAAARLNKELPDTCSAFLEGRIETAIAVSKVFLKLNSPLGKPRAEWQVAIHGRQAIKGIRAFIQERRDVMTPEATLPDEEKLHAIRKAMKDILYTWPCFPDDVAVPFLPEKWRSREVLNACTDILGEFHDICILLNLLQDALFIMSVNEQASDFLEEVRQLWRKDKEEILERLRHMLLSTAGTGRENPLAPGDLKAESYELHVD
ncbi:MAG TPA: CHAD domain-containing protein [Puia sp.]|nr:CHAD domain-containing protein [Puia sp.]